MKNVRTLAILSTGILMIALTGCDKKTVELQSTNPSFKNRSVYILDDGTRHKDSARLAIQFQLNEDLVENWVYQNNDSALVMVFEDSFDITLTNIGSKSGSNYFLSVAEQEAIYNRIVDSIEANPAYDDTTYIGISNVRQISFTGGLSTFNWTLRVRGGGLRVIEYTSYDYYWLKHWEEAYDPLHLAPNGYCPDFIKHLTNDCEELSCDYVTHSQTKTFTYNLSTTQQSDLDILYITIPEQQDIMEAIDGQAPGGYAPTYISGWLSGDNPIGGGNTIPFYLITVEYVKCSSNVTNFL